MGKTPEQHKEEFLKRAGVGFLLKHWRMRYPNRELISEDEPVLIKIYDVIWSRETGQEQYHTWPEEEFKKILDVKGHFKRGHEGKKKRKNLAKKYRKGRSKK